MASASHRDRFFQGGKRPLIPPRARPFAGRSKCTYSYWRLKAPPVPHRAPPCVDSGREGHPFGRSRPGEAPEDRPQRERRHELLGEGLVAQVFRERRYDTVRGSKERALPLSHVRRWASTASAIHCRSEQSRRYGFTSSRAGLWKAAGDAPIRMVAQDVSDGHLHQPLKGLLVADRSKSMGRLPSRVPTPWIDRL